jgi:hypothetical protein
VRCAAFEGGWYGVLSRPAIPGEVRGEASQVVCRAAVSSAAAVASVIVWCVAVSPVFSEVARVGVIIPYIVVMAGGKVSEGSSKEIEEVSWGGGPCM